MELLRAFRILGGTFSEYDAVEKQYVRTLFDSIARRYDFLNHFLSAGIDRFWRRRAIGHLEDLRPRRILDIATGTGDFAIAALRLGPEKVIGVDIAEEMLAEGRKKIASRGLDGLIILQSGDAERLAFADATFDAAIVAFGVRNFENLRTGLAEMRRVLRPGGKAVVLEFSRPERAPMRQIYFWYFKKVLPLIGAVISRSKTAYRYLPETVMAFPQGEEFLRLLRESGYSSATEERLTFGIVSIYTGVR